MVLCGLSQRGDLPREPPEGLCGPPALVVLIIPLGLQPHENPKWALDPLSSRGVLSSGTPAFPEHFILR